MLRSKALSFGALFAAGSLGLAGCGGDGGGDTVSADAFAQDICTSVGDWVQTVQDKAGAIGESIDPNASPEEGKEALGNFLGEIVADTEQLVSEVEDAGVPDVDGGEEISQDLTAAFEEAQRILEDAQADVEDFPTDDPQAFAEAAGNLGPSVQEALGEVGNSLQSTDSAEELQQAFEDEAACAEVQGGA